MVPGVCFAFNLVDESTPEVVTLPAGWAAEFPAIACLLYVYSKHPEIELESYRYHSDFNLDSIWRPLLNNSSELSPYNFPPEILTAMGNALEIQATLMLLHMCDVQTLNLMLELPLEPNKELPRLLKIIRRSGTTDDTALFKSPAQLRRIQSIQVTDVSTSSNPSFTCVDDFTTMLEMNRCLLAFWVGEDAFLTSKPIEDAEHKEIVALLNMLSTYAKEQVRRFNSHITSPLARYYIYTGTSASDEVVIDRMFLRTYTGSEKEIWAETVSLYAHIKCALPYSTEKLDAVIEHCRAKGLDYWLAYFLSYGQVVHTYNGLYNRKIHLTRLTEAFRIYKKLGDWIGITRALHSKSTLLSKELNFRNANRYLEICLGIRYFIQDSLGIARVLNGISYLKSQIENFDSAIEHAEQAIRHLEMSQQYEELAFTFCQISWYYFLIDNHPKSVEYGVKTIETMQDRNISTLPFRTKPDIHAQLGLAYVLNGEQDEALLHSDYCESHKVDSTATGEILRIILRAMINDYRGDTHLADIGYDFVPEILSSNPEIDPHLELIYYRFMIERLTDEKESWKIKKLKKDGIRICHQKGYQKSREWFQ
jgi:tetratricopeptide (TPR) repeat protein